MGPKRLDRDTGISQGKKGAGTHTRHYFVRVTSIPSFYKPVVIKQWCRWLGHHYRYCNPQDLVTWLEQARSGGGLAYGFGGTMAIG